MSDWASVIVCWSGNDDACRGDAEVDRRLRVLREKYMEKRGRRFSDWKVSYSCGDRSIGPACEVVALAHVNHFDPYEMVAILRAMEWEMPDQVQVVYKSEQMDGYAIVPLHAVDPYRLPDEAPLQ